MGFYDLRNSVLCENSHRDKLIYSVNLPHSIKVYIFNNLYYYFDYNESSILASSTNPTSLDEFKDECASVNLHFQKEVINAFNACIYIASMKANYNVTYSDDIKRLIFANGIDQYFIPNNVDKDVLPFSTYLSCSEFSTEMYRIACKSEYSKNPCYKQEMSLRVEEGLNMLMQLLETDCTLIKREYNKSWFNILSNIWKVVFFKSHNLRFEATILIKSVYDSLVRRHTGKSSNPLPTQHDSYHKGVKLPQSFTEFSNIRNNAAHELKIIQSHSELKKLDGYIGGVINLFNRDSNIDISFINK